MKELNEVVTHKIAAMTEDGSIEKLIEQNIEKTIAEIIKSSLQTYGEFGKALSAKVEESMHIAGYNIELPKYTNFILEVVKTQFIKVLDENAVSYLNENISKIIEPVEKQSSFSKLLAEIEEAVGDYAREAGKELIEIKEDENSVGNSIYVTFNDPDDFYIVKATFYNFNKDKESLWHIGYINQNNKCITRKFSSEAGVAMGSITNILYKYYLMGTNFERDVDFEDIYVGND
jgi:hypothetical protein